MRLEADWSRWNPHDFARQIALVLDTEPSLVNIVNGRLGASGISVAYFEIQNPPQELPASNSTTKAASSNSTVRALSGNEKMLLLYQWWLTDDVRMSDFYEPIIDFKIYSFSMEDDGKGGEDQQAITLFASDDPINPIVPRRPGTDWWSIDSSHTRSEDTFYFTLSIGNGRSNSQANSSSSKLGSNSSLIFSSICSLVVLFVLMHF